MQKASDICVAKVYTVIEEASMWWAWQEMNKRRVRHLIVTPRNRSNIILGIISMGDIAKHLAPDQADENLVNTIEQIMSGLHVGDKDPDTGKYLYMTGVDDLVMVTESESIIDVAKKLCSLHHNHYIKLVPVVASDTRVPEIRGVIAYQDILKHWAKFPKAEEIGKLTGRDFGQSWDDVITIGSDKHIPNAYRKLGMTRYRHLPVIGPDESVINIISDVDIYTYLPEASAEDALYEKWFETTVGEMPIHFKQEQLILPETIRLWAKDASDNNPTIVWRFLNTHTTKLDKLYHIGALVIKDSNGHCVRLISPADALAKLIGI